MNERERFPVPQEAIDAALAVGVVPGLNAPGKPTPQSADPWPDLRAAAPYLIRAWIDGLSDDDLLSLRFSGYNWCAQMRAELRRLAGDPSA